MQGTGLAVYNPYPRGLKRPTIYRCNYKDSTLFSYSKTLSVGPAYGSNPQPPVQPSGTLPTELTTGGAP